MKNILVIGATSAIAEATARLFAESGYNLYLLARNREKLSVMAKDLEIRGAKNVQHHTIEVTDHESHEEIITEAFQHMGHIDITLIAHGTLPDQTACEKSFNQTHSELNINAIGTISLLTHLANQYENQGSGAIAVITSVAGERGRQSNYIYGSAKNMVSTFLQGLRNRLYKHGVQVLDIKPGFVDTPMTSDFDKGPLWAKPETIAHGVVKGIDKGKHVIYTPFFWRYIMLIIKSIPELIFKRLSL
jgi:short-subunit dehydrogenase